MPIYEYLCPDCNRVFSFLIRGSDKDKDPSCPKCERTGLKKMISRFAVTGATRKSEPTGGVPAGGEEGADPLDDPRVEREMMKLMSEADQIDENDPRQLGRLMRRMTEITGEGMEPEMQEAIRRLEAGEDPEKIEEDLGDVLGEADDDGMGGYGGGPSYDDGLYTM